MEFRAMADHDLSRISTNIAPIPRRHRRRDFLSVGAAAAAVVAGITAPSAADAADPFTFARVASTDDDHDAAILNLFHRWRNALQVANAATDDDDLDIKTDIASELEEQIFAAPISGTVGLAVKAYMLAYEAGHEVGAAGVPGLQAGTLGRLSEHSYSQRYDSRTDSWSEDAYLYLMPQALLGALNAVVRFCPELAPLAAGALSSPRVLPVDEGDAA
jgi:hypothetical protein